MAAKGKWPTKRLGELAEFRNGVNYNKSSFGVGIKVVGVSDFQDYTKPRYAELEQINPKGIVTERNILRDGDIVFVRSNGNRELIGRSLFIEKPPEKVTHSAFSIRLRFTSREVHPKFYAYCFRTPLIRQGLTASGGGTNISNLNQDILNALEVPVPPIPVQKRIAGILTAYDELIENNQRRIRILETMARALYREWFVHFRTPSEALAKGGRFPRQGIEPTNKGFPAKPALELNRGHQHFHAALPKGWEVKPLNDVVEDIVDYRGKTPKKLNGDWSNEGILALSALNVKGGRLVSLEKSRCVNEDLYSRWMKNPLRRGDILMTSEAPLGELYFLCKEERYCLSQRLFSIRANRSVIAPVILYLCMESEETQHELRSRASGATVSGIRQSELRNISVIVPPQSVQNRAEPILQDLAEQKSTLDAQTQNLRRTRDLLLPRLLSGETTVNS